MATDPRAAIFDLDQTLVDSRSIESLRKARQWTQVYGRISTLTTYDGVLPIIARLRSAGIATAIVTSSPYSYCSKVLLRCGLQFDTCVCYHDTKRKKPDPEPMLVALEKLGGVLPESAVAIGDSVADIQSAKAACIYTIAAVWGSIEPDALAAQNPGAIVRSVGELDSFLIKYFDISDAGSPV
jgi:HAD superfamily hydrolase (TIGR01509 family)